jgi:hypothetical protein
MARSHDWMSLTLDGWKLAAEASSVIGLRLAKFASLNASAAAEAHRMIAEKVEAAAVLQLKAMTGALGTTPTSGAGHAISHYRKAVGRNRRRLGRSKRR